MTRDAETRLLDALAPLAEGRWILGVSGGLDSVALLVGLLSFRPELELIVAHLNHETRGDQSDADADFVAALCASRGVRCLVRRLGERSGLREVNPEARFREARHALFRELLDVHRARGVLLGHHADDRAETVLMRLLRNGEAWSLDALRRDAVVDGVRLVRPLLDVRRATLEALLRDRGQPWREDASNASDAFARNRVRRFLASRPDLTARLLALSERTSAWRSWVEAHTPSLMPSVPLNQIADVPDPLCRNALRRWLRAQRVPVEDVTPAQIDQLIAMSRDRSTPATINLPGGRTARRRKGVIALDGTSDADAGS